MLYIGSCVNSRRTCRGGSTHHNQSDEIREVPEGMSVLYIIHDVHPTLQTDHLHAGHTGDERNRMADKLYMESVYCNLV